MGVVPFVSFGDHTHHLVDCDYLACQQLILFLQLLHFEIDSLSFLACYVFLIVECFYLHFVLHLQIGQGKLVFFGEIVFHVLEILLQSHVLQSLCIQFLD